MARIGFVRRASHTLSQRPSQAVRISIRSRQVFIERANLSVRMHLGRLTRLTNGFLKKLEAAVAVFMAWHNFCGVHQTLRASRPRWELGLPTRFGQSSGLNIYNVMRALPFDITIHNVGNVDSIGNAVFLAGSKRYACPHSTFMFHGVGFDIQSPIRLEEKFLRERLDALDADHRRIGQIMEERTQLTGEQIKGLFLEAQTKDATFAVGCGIVHEIRDVQIPPGGPIVSLVFQR